MVSKQINPKLSEPNAPNQVDLEGECITVLCSNGANRNMDEEIAFDQLMYYIIRNNRCLNLLKQRLL